MPHSHAYSTSLITMVYGVLSYCGLKALTDHYELFYVGNKESHFTDVLSVVPQGAGCVGTLTVLIICE